MDFLTYFILFLAALLGGGINAVAGGGTFLVFPLLILTGMPAVQANATTTMALWPGSLASVAGYREELKQNRHLLPPLMVISLLGGAAGALTLLWTPETTFRALIPWLLLAATLIFSFGRTRIPTIAHPALARGIQLIIAFYGGYFGAGIGILMLAMLQLMGMHHIHQMNALKTVLASAINAVAVGIFIFSGLILWPAALVMLAGAVIGGFGAAHLSRRVAPDLVRRAVMAYGWVMTAYFFVCG